MSNLREILLWVGGLLIISGIIVSIAAFLLPAMGKWRLPGDIVLQRGNVTCFFPLATMILLSIVLTVALNLLLRMLRK